MKKQIEFECQFCKKEFTSEKRLLNHVCEQKRRHLQRDELPVRLGYIAYNAFYEKKMGAKERHTYERFCTSTVYTSFVRFGRYINNLHMDNPNGFIDFVIKMDLPIQEWTNSVLAETYIKEINKAESPSEGMERSIKLIQKWAMENNEHWIDFFRKVSTNRVVLWFIGGKISPWMLFLAPSASELLERMTSEQQDHIEKIVDMRFWKLKIERHKAEVERIGNILKDSGL